MSTTFDVIKKSTYVHLKASQLVCMDMQQQFEAAGRVFALHFGVVCRC